MGADYSDNNTNIKASLEVNSNTGSASAKLGVETELAPGRLLDLSLGFSVKNHIELSRVVASYRFQLYKQDLLLGVVADPYWQYQLRKNSPLVNEMKM